MGTGVGTGVGVGVGLGVADGVGVGVGVELEDPPKVRRGEITQPAKAPVKTSKPINEKPIFCFTTTPIPYSLA